MGITTNFDKLCHLTTARHAVRGVYRKGLSLVQMCIAFSRGLNIAYFFLSCHSFASQSQPAGIGKQTQGSVVDWSLEREVLLSLLIQTVNPRLTPKLNNPNRAL